MILFLGLIIISGIIRWTTILSRNRVIKEKIDQYHVRQAFFTNSIQDSKFFLWMPGWLADPYPLGVVYRKT